MIIFSPFVFGERRQINKEVVVIHQALYRKYRPGNFDQVVGQDHITTILKNEISGHKIAHSYLFTGSRGTGKTSCAKILAKAINCLKPLEGNPCGICDICRGIDEGSILDISEIDAASNSGVEHIRLLREEAFFTPGVAKYRAYIIDEVHMLSNAASNALLKIMEEPPSHVVFILATTEIHKVLPTVISRCQRFDFRRIDIDTITAQLKHICELEGFTIEDDAARIIAGLAEGGMRDALSLLDVCASYSNNITTSTVVLSAGIIGVDHMFEFAKLITEKDTKSLLDKLDQILATSVEPSRFCDQLISHYRNLMLTKTIDDPTNLLSYLPSYLPQLKSQSAVLSLPQILYTLTVLQDVSVRLSRTAVKKVELEVALVRLSQPQTKFDPDSFVSRLENLEIAVKNKAVPMAQNTTEKLETKQAGTNTQSPEQAEKPAPSPTPVPIAAAPAAKKQAASKTVEFGEWKQTLIRLAKINPAVAGMLGGSKAYDDGRRVLIDIQNPALLEMLKSNDYTKNSIKQAIQDVTGKAYGIGPYKAPAPAEKVEDNFFEFIDTLPESDVIKIN